MLFKNLFLFAAVAIAAPIVPRTTPTQIANDITALDNAVKTLTSALNSYSGGLFGVLQMPAVIAAFEAVHMSNRAAYNDAQSLGALSTADSVSLVNLVQNTLVVDNPIAVGVTEAKKPLFGPMISPEILSALQTLLSDHTSLSAVLVPKVCASELDAANAAVATITNALEGGIAFYSS